MKLDLWIGSSDATRQATCFLSSEAWSHPIVVIVVVVFFRFQEKSDRRDGASSFHRVDNRSISTTVHSLGLE